MRVFLGLGSNLGDRLGHLRDALSELEARGVTIVARSSVWQSAPVGPAQPDYLNAVVEVETALSPRELLAACKQLERERGRDPQGLRWGPRPLDVDLLLADVRVDEPDLQVPHAQLANRAFVLRPLCEVCAPSRLHPVLGVTLGELRARVVDQVCDRAEGLTLG